MTSDINNVCLINGVQYKCRTCFDPGRIIHSLTEEANPAKTWHQVLKDIAQLQTKDDELLPKTLCCNCLEKLKRSYEFVLQIQTVNKKYSELLIKEGFANEVDNSADCLAESTIALPLDDIKLEEEMVVSYDINMSRNLEDGGETNFENQDYDDPFNETLDEGYKEENESAKAKSGKSATKRNRGKKVNQSDDNKEVCRKPVKRSKKAKQPKKTSHTDESNETQNINEDDDVKDLIICDKCSQAFASIHTYQRHQQAEHSSESNEKNKCPICSKEFRNSWYVVDHIKVVHDKLKPYKCSHCPKSFASAHSKRIHELTHTDNFPYSCEYCDRRFRLSSKLKIHSEIHTTKPELLCPICKRSQKSQEELEQHVKNHDDNRLQCPSCGNLFRRNAQLKDHYNAVHLKLRPYKCEFCELGFGDRKTRRVHQRTHHKQELTISYSSSSNEDEGESPCSSSFTKNCGADNPFSQSVKLPRRRKPFPQDDVIEKINENCFLCLLCKKTLTLLRNCRRHVSNVHSIDSPTQRIRVKKDLQMKAGYDVDTKNSMENNDSNLPFGNRLYSKPTNWRLVECKLCSMTFKTCKTLRQHLENHVDVDTLHSLKLSDKIVQHLFPNMDNLKLIKENISNDVRKKQWFKYYTVLNEHFYEMSVSDTEVEELANEHAERSNKYKCAFCAREFAFKYQVYPHLKQAHSKREVPFKCGRCKLPFVSIKMYTQHLQTHCNNKDKSLLCENCPGKFVWAENIKKHNCITEITATTPNNFENRLKDLQDNIRRDSSDLDSILSTVTAVFINDNATDLEKTSLLNNEAKQNVNNTSKLIHELNAASESTSELSQNTPETKTKDVCLFCYVSFSDSSKLQLHTMTCHTNAKTFKCRLCEMAFMRATDLESHRLTHKGEYAFKCMFCEKSFESRAQLQDHKRRNHKDRIYKCTICPKAFKTSSSLKKHFRIHSEKKSFECPHCEKGFPGPQKLKNHIRIHTGERPYKCTFCNKAFSMADRLKLHLRLHTGEKPFRCDICGQAYACHPYLKKHRITKGHFTENK